MENETDVIRNQMMETRTSLTEKLEALEDKVVSTVQDTTETVTEAVQAVTETVQDTVSNVSESVQDTVESVKSTFDLPRQVQNHPWALFGGAVVVGFLGGKLFPSLGTVTQAPSAAAGLAAGGGSSSPSMPYTAAPTSTASSFTGSGSSSPSSSTGSSSANGAGWLGSLTENLGPVADQLKGMAIGTLTGVVGEMVLQSTPENFRPQLADWLEQLTKSLGGTPIQGLTEYVNSLSGSTSQQPDSHQHSSTQTTNPSL